MKQLQRDTLQHRVPVGKTLSAERSEDGQASPAALGAHPRHCLADLVRGSRGRQGWQGSGRRRWLAGIPVLCPPPPPGSAQR